MNDVIKLRSTHYGAALAHRFQFTKQVVFEARPLGEEILPEDDRIKISSDAQGMERELPELISLARLADIDPLLVLFVGQSAPTAEEARYLGMFQQLCEPVRTGWAYKLMRRYVPEVYQREIAEIENMFREEAAGALRRGAGDLSETSRNSMVGLFAILYQDEEHAAEMTMDENRQLSGWHRYLDAVKEAVRAEPDPDGYLNLPRAAEVPYTVTIASGDVGRRHYDVRKSGRVNVRLHGG